jgi:hypothetical protein
MSVLRLLLSAPPSASRAEAWALFDDAGRVVDRGRAAPDRWPSAGVREAVLAASLVRVIPLALPPMSAARVASAAAYALEDRLAVTDDAPAIGVSTPRADGSVIAAVVSRRTLDAVIATTPRFARVLVEPALAPVHAAWTWYASDAGGGFVRTSDGGAFAVASSPGGATLPPELTAALTQAARKGHAPREVIVAERCTPDVLASWRAACGVPFVAGTPWRWDAATSTAFADAPDLLSHDATPATQQPGERWRMLRPAIAIAVAALALNIAATIGQWAWLKYSSWSAARSIVAAAQSAGIADATTADAALRALARQDAAMRHRAGAIASDDALPLLARAAPALATLPSGAIKSAAFVDGAWTVELAALDAPALSALDRRLQDAGLAPLQAKTNAGYRMRVTAAP